MSHETRTPVKAFGQIAPCATVFVSSGCIMILELLAGRLISRHVGQSLYTWTAIIGVVLAGLAAGNYIGGRIADRRWGRGVLAVQFLLAAAGCLVIFPLNTLAGAMFAQADMNWPLRIFLHVTLTFLLPSTLLGTISPVISKRALNTGYAAGRVVGNIYASSIAGSILGTFFTGFYLLMKIGTTYAAASAAIMLGVMGIVYALGALTDRSTGRAAERTGPEPAASASKPVWGILVAVFVANACVMAVEVVAGRILARYYGQSLYTWTTIIGIVLAGMSAGSYLGGRMTQWFDTRKSSGGLFIAASVCCLIIPFSARYFHNLLASYPLTPLPLQIMYFSLILFLLPSILIAAAMPILLRAALDRNPNAGRTVGSVFAWGSLGSIAGTFLAGFYLIAAAGTILTLFLVAVTLGVLGVACGRTRSLGYIWAASGLAVLVILLAPFKPLAFLRDRMAWAEFAQSRTYYSAESQYSCINILADEENENIREMVLDRLIHSRIDLMNPTELKYEYEWVYAAVTDEVFPAGRPVRALVIGGGGYTFPRFLELTRPGSHVEVAEIDPAVTEAARAAFGLPGTSSIQIHHMDARNRIADLVRLKQKGAGAPGYDLIYGDSVNDYSVPYHLTTFEFNEQIAMLLNEHGLYLLNIIDIFNPGRFLAAVVNTCRKTFPYVYVFNRHASLDERDTFIIVGAKRPLKLDHLPAQIAAGHDYSGSLIPQSDLDALIKRNGSLVLTDDFAPVENLLAPVVVRRQ